MSHRSMPPMRETSIYPVETLSPDSRLNRAPPGPGLGAPAGVRASCQRLGKPSEKALALLQHPLLVSFCIPCFICHLPLHPF